MADKKSCVDRITKSKAFELFMKFHALILVIIGFLIGLLAPAPGIYLSKLNLGGFCFPPLPSSVATAIANNSTVSPNCVFDKVNHIPITIIFFLSGLGLEISQIKSALGNWKSVLGGLFLILFTTSIPAIPVFSSALLASPPDFAFGLGLFLLCPATLATGVAIVKVANGSVPLSVILTVSSNLLGVVTVPLAITIVLPIYQKFLQSLNYTTGNGKPVQITIDAIPLITNLFFTVFIPIIIGIITRAYLPPRVNKFYKAHKQKISFFANFLLGSITWLQSSTSSSAFSSVSVGSLFAILFVFIMVHFTYLIFNAAFARYVLRCDSDDFKAVVIMGMQKSLAMCLTLISMLPKDISPNLGMAAIPVIISQLVQTIVDSYIASMWAKKTFTTYQGRHPKPAENVDGKADDKTDSPKNSEPTDAVKPTDLADSAIPVEASDKVEPVEQNPPPEKKNGAEAVI